MTRGIPLWRIRSALSFRHEDIRSGCARSLRVLRSLTARGLLPVEVAMDDSAFSRPPVSQSGSVCNTRTLCTVVQSEA